jgi:tyrosyl-tRNA synthetase
VLFREGNRSLKIKRPTKYGGPIEVQSYSELQKTYLEGNLHPLDLKLAVGDNLIDLLKPVREYFAKNPEPLEAMKRITITR